MYHHYVSVAEKEDWTHRNFANLSGDDENRAREAFESLCESSRAAGFRMLSRSGIRDADAEDLIQSAFAELWSLRKTLSASTPGAWYALVRRSLSWQISKRIQKREREKAVSEQLIPDDELPYLDEMVFASEDRRRLYAAADDLWLGEVENDLVMGIAAARLILVEGLGKDDVTAMFDVSEDVVGRWLRQEALLTRAAYLGLFWPVDQLAGYVLCPERPLTTAQLNQLTTSDEAAELSGWTLTEARIVCWRLRNGLTKRDIVRTSAGTLDLNSVEAALRKLHAALPLVEIARSVRKSLTDVGQSRALTMPGIWKRLAFQYALHDLPNSQIVDLVGPPASVGSFIIDAAKLNRWVTSGLLFSQLASYVREHRS